MRKITTEQPHINFIVRRGSFPYSLTCWFDGHLWERPDRKTTTMAAKPGNIPAATAKRLVTAVRPSRNLFQKNTKPTSEAVRK